LKVLGAPGAEIFEIEIFTISPIPQARKAIFSPLWPRYPKFSKYYKNYLGTGYIAVTTALSPRLEANEICFLAKFRVYRFKHGGDVNFRKFMFSENPLGGVDP